MTVRPQVDGKLLSVNFKEGQDVKKGDVLARIDPVIYQAQLDQAIAKKAQDEAQLANSQDRPRALREDLPPPHAINKQQADTQRALVAQHDALVQADQAAIDNAQAMLGYTDDHGADRRAAPASAWSTRATSCVPPMPTGIVVITQMRPISVLFNLPQQELAASERRLRQGPAQRRSAALGQLTK